MEAQYEVYVTDGGEQLLIDPTTFVLEVNELPNLAYMSHNLETNFSTYFNKN